MRLREDLRRHGVEVWIDREQIRPGHRWKASIRSAISEGAFFCALFTEEYSARSRSYMNEELTLAIEALRLRPIDRAWFIPLVLTPGALPDRSIGGGETLRDLQWIDLSEDWEAGVNALVSAIKGKLATDEDMKILTRISSAVASGDQERLRYSLELTSERAFKYESIIDAFIAGLVKESRFNTLLVSEFCRDFGTDFSLAQIVRVFDCSENPSHALTFLGYLYDHECANVREYGLPIVFADRPTVSYYCKLRERHWGETLDTILGIRFPPSRRHRQNSDIDKVMMVPDSEIEIDIDGFTVDRQKYVACRRTAIDSYAFLEAVPMSEIRVHPSDPRQKRV